MVERMSRLVLWLWLAAVVFCGCNRHSPASQSGSGAESAAADGAAPSPRGLGKVAEAPGNVVVTNTESTTATLDQLSQELRRYVIRTRSVPKTFDEFAANTQLQAPPAPDGKRYAIQGQAVVLVNK